MPNSKIDKVNVNGTTYDIQDTISGYTTNTGTITSVKTTAGTHTTIDVSSGAANFNVPTKTSHLQNDSGFITGQTETDPIFVASAAHGISSSDISNWNSKTSNTGTVTEVTAGTGLKIGTATSGGTISTSGTINHINSVTAQTTQAVYPIKIDAQGHISEYGSAVTSMPASDVSSWAKASTKPTYTASEVGAITSSDASSMISNAIGVHDDETATTYLLIVSNGTAQLKDSSMTNLIRIAALRQDYLLKHKIIIVQMISGTATRSYTIANVNMATSSTGTVDMFAADDDYVYYVQLTDSGSGLTGTYQEIPVGGTGTVTSITAGAGLSGGTITSSGTIAHSNSVTAQNTQAVYPIKIDAQGHISAYGSAVTIPTVPTNVSSFTNDAGYLTLSTLPIYDGTVT